MPAPVRLTTLFDAATIALRVNELGRRIRDDYADRELTAVIVLRGAFVFAADLLRAIDLPLRVETIGLRSYGAATRTSGVVELTLDLAEPVEGRHLLVVEDIVDTGLTLSYLLDNLRRRGAASLAVAALLHKPARAVIPVPIDYLGFTVPDRFVVGYGLDADGLYRNRPDIAVGVD